VSKRAHNAAGTCGERRRTVTRTGGRTRAGPTPPAAVPSSWQGARRAPPGAASAPDIDR